MELETYKGVKLSFDGTKFSGVMTGLASGQKTISRASLAAVKKAIDTELANAITVPVVFLQSRSYSSVPSPIKVVGLKKTRDKYGPGHDLVIEREKNSGYYGATTEIKFETVFVQNEETTRIVAELEKLEQEKREYEEKHRLAYRALRDQLEPFQVKSAEEVESILIEASKATPPDTGGV